MKQAYYLSLILQFAITPVMADFVLTDENTGCKVVNSQPLKNYSVQWSGSCVDGFAHGMGSMQWYYYGKPDGRYDGEYFRGKMHGLGTYAMPYGSRHTGHYFNNMRSGQGTYLWDDGTRFEGNYKDGQMEGQGRTTWADGSSYSGEYKANKKHGFGILRLTKNNPKIADYPKGEWDGDFWQLKGLFANDNFIFVCSKKDVCLDRLRANK